MPMPMISRLLGRQDRFFNLFGSLSSHLVEGARENGKLMRDLSQSAIRFQRLRELERRGDELNHQTVALLRKSFTTPLDRNDMHSLAGSLDNVLDAIETAAHRVHMYDVKQLPIEAYQLAELGIATTEQVQSAITGLFQIKAPEPILRACAEIDRLNGDADVALQAALVRLFGDSYEPQEILKLKEICELLKEVPTGCNQVGNIIDRIVLAEFA